MYTGATEASEYPLCRNADLNGASSLFRKRALAAKVTRAVSSRPDSEISSPALRFWARGRGIMFSERRQRRVEEREKFRPSIMNAVCWQMMDLLKAKRRGTANPSARKL